MQKTVSKDFKYLKGEINIPSDKSISHRAVMFSSLAKGKSVIRNFSDGADPNPHLKYVKDWEFSTEFKNNELIITSSGKFTPQKEVYPYHCGNSGTTMRLMTGILAGQNFDSVLTGDESLFKPPNEKKL